jgi:hypothetical protein
MNLLRRLLLLLLALLALGGLLLAWMSRHSFQRVPETVNVGYKGEALENQTLLLQKWLEADGRKVLRKGGELLAAELPEQGVLILLRVSQPITTRETETLLAWVRRGGHLVTDGTAAPFNDERGLQTLHRALGVKILNQKEKDLNLFSTETKHQARDTFHTGETPYRVRRSARWRLVADKPDDWDYRMGHEQLDVLLTRPEGDGRLTLTPDLSFLYHWSLTQEDHAAYFQRLLRFHPAPGPIVVWSKPVELSLFRWLWDHARLPVIGLLVLVLAWIWKGWPRFGPLRPDPQPQRRSLLEHLAASARLMWRGGGGEHLLARTRAALEHRAQRLNPAYGALDLGAKAEWLAEATGGSADAIASALDDRPGRPAHTLVQDLLTLERLRQRL